MTILQMYLTNDTKRHDIEVEEVGKGKLVWIPCGVLQREKQDFKLRNLYLLLFEGGILKFQQRLLKYIRNQFVLLQKEVLVTIRDYGVDLISFHWLNYDSKDIVVSAVENGIPYVFVNHFENELYNSKMVKRQIAHARALAGVSKAKVPEHIRARYVDLSDGIDTDFFDPERANHPDVIVEKPIIFLPSRIAERKGHVDLVEAVARLKSAGTSVRLVFAGRIDSEKLFHNLKSTIAHLDLNEDVFFLGPLDQEALRNWYAQCDAVVLPTQMEGMPRVLLEAQSMKKPVIAYDAGGSTEAMKDGETGFVIPKNDIKQLAEKIAELLGDDRKKIQMGLCGRDFIVNRYALAKLAERHEEFYKNALKSTS